MLCFVFSFNYNGFSPKAYLSSLLYFLFPLCLFFCQADITAPWSPIWMEAFPQHGKHNLTEPSALSRTHIPEASTVHQTKAVWASRCQSQSEILAISNSLMLWEAWGAPGGKAADVIGWRAGWPCTGAQGYIPTWGWWAAVWACAWGHTDFSSRTGSRLRF